MKKKKIFSEDKISFLLSPAIIDSILIYFITGDAMGWGGGGVVQNRIIAILFLLSPLFLIVYYKIGSSNFTNFFVVLFYNFF